MHQGAAPRVVNPARGFRDVVGIRLFVESEQRMLLVGKRIENHGSGRAQFGHTAHLRRVGFVEDFRTPLRCLVHCRDLVCAGEVLHHDPFRFSVVRRALITRPSPISKHFVCEALLTRVRGGADVCVGKP